MMARSKLTVPCDRNPSHSCTSSRHLSDCASTPGRSLPPRKSDFTVRLRNVSSCSKEHLTNAIGNSICVSDKSSIPAILAPTIRMPAAAMLREGLACVISVRTASAESVRSSGQRAPSIGSFSAGSVELKSATLPSPAASWSRDSAVLCGSGELNLPYPLSPASWYGAPRWQANNGEVSLCSHRQGSRPQSHSIATGPRSPNAVSAKMLRDKRG
jgi:hypothetical protein